MDILLTLHSVAANFYGLLLLMDPYVAFMVFGGDPAIPKSPELAQVMRLFGGEGHDQSWHFVSKNHSVGSYCEALRLHVRIRLQESTPLTHSLPFPQLP